MPGKLSGLFFLSLLPGTDRLKRAVSMDVPSATSITVSGPYEATAMNNDQKIHYRPLSGAIYDNSQPDFDPRSLEYGSNSTYLGSTKLSSTFSLVPLRKLSGSADCPSKPPPFSFLKEHSATSEKLHLASGFEAPQWRNILIHTAMCLVSYPTLLAVMLVARNKSLFWTRFIVGVGCGVVGLCLGYSLLMLAKSHLEAASKFYRHAIF